MTYIELLLKLLMLILHRGKRLFKVLLEEVMKNVTGGTIFQKTNDQGLPASIESCTYEINGNFYSEENKTLLSAELVRSFCHDAISPCSVCPFISLAYSQCYERENRKRFNAAFFNHALVA